MASTSTSAKPNGSKRDDSVVLRCGCIFIDCPSHLEWIKPVAMLQADCNPEHRFPHPPGAYFFYPLPLVRDAIEKKAPLPFIRCAKAANNPRITERRDRIVVDLKVEKYRDRDACEEVLMAELHNSVETSSSFWAFETMVIPLPRLSEASSRNPILCRFELDVPISLKEQLIQILDDGSSRKLTYVLPGKETVPEIMVPRSISPEAYPTQSQMSRAPALGRPPIQFSSERSPPSTYGRPPPPQYPPPYGHEVDSQRRPYYDAPYPPNDYRGGWEPRYDDPYRRNSREDSRAGPSTYGPIHYDPYYPPDPRLPSPVGRGLPPPYPPEPMLMTREEAEARRLSGGWSYGAPNYHQDYRRHDYDYPPAPRYPTNWSHVPRAGEGDLRPPPPRRPSIDVAGRRTISNRSPESPQAASPTKSTATAALSAPPRSASGSVPKPTIQTPTKGKSTTSTAVALQISPVQSTPKSATVPTPKSTTAPTPKSATVPVTPVVSKPTPPSTGGGLPHHWYDLIKEPRGADGSEMRCACYYLDPPEWVVILNSRENLLKPKTYPTHRIDHTPYSYHYLPLRDLTQRKIHMGSRPDWKAIREEPKTIRAVVDYILRDLTASRQGSAIEDRLRSAFDGIGISLKQVWRKDSLELTKPSWRYVSRYEINLPVLSIPAFIAAVGSGRVTDLELIWIPRFEKCSDVWDLAQAAAPVTTQYQPSAPHSHMPPSKSLDKTAHKALFRADGSYIRPLGYKHWCRVVVDFHLVPQSKTDKVEPANSNGRVRTALGSAGIFFVRTMESVGDPAITPIGWMMRYELELNTENIPKLVAGCGSNHNSPIRLIWAPTYAEHMLSTGGDQPTDRQAGASVRQSTAPIELPASPDPTELNDEDVEMDAGPSEQRLSMSGAAVSPTSASLLRPPDQSSAAQRKPTPEIIDLTASPAESPAGSPASRPADLRDPIQSRSSNPATAPSTQEPGGSSSATYNMPHPRLQGHQLHVHVTNPPQQTPAYHAFGPPPVVRAPAYKRPKEVIDLSAMSDQGSPEPPQRQDGPGSSAELQHARSPQTGMVATRYQLTADDRHVGESSHGMDIDRPGMMNGHWHDREYNDGDEIMTSTEVFTIGNSHYSASPITVKPEPRMLTPTEEKEVTDWYKGASKRKQQLMEQQANGGIRGRTRGVPVAERENGRSSSRNERYRGYSEHLSPGLVDYPPPMNGMPIHPQMMQPMPVQSITYQPYIINNAKLQPLTLTGNGTVVLGTCRKLFRRYKIEMCHGCDTKQRCSKKDMWKMPDPNDPVGARLIAESAAAAASGGSQQRNYHHHMNGGGPDPRGMPPGMHPGPSRHVPHMPYPSPHGYPPMPGIPPDAGYYGYPPRMPPPAPYQNAPYPFEGIIDPRTPPPGFGMLPPKRIPPLSELPPWDAKKAIAEYELSRGGGGVESAEAGPSTSRGQKRPRSPSLQ